MMHADAVLSFTWYIYGRLGKGWDALINLILYQGEIQKAWDVFVAQFKCATLQHFLLQS